MKRGRVDKNKFNKIFFISLVFIILGSIFVLSTTSISDNQISTFNATFLGNVGIGTSTPSQTLDVRGQGNFSGTVFINNATNLLSYYNKNSKTSNVVSYNKGNVSIAGYNKVNQSDGFSASFAGNTLNPYGITQDLRDNSFWIVDGTDDFIYHVSSLGVNQSDGFSASFAGAALAPYGITQDLRDNSFWIVDSTDNFVYHVSSLGVNQSDGFSASFAGAAPAIVFITQDLRDNSFWIIDFVDDFIYHVSSLGVNQSDGFSASFAGAAPDPGGITQDLRDNSFWITDSTDDFIYHVSSLGVNQSDGFSASFAGAIPNLVGITQDLRDNSFWITDSTDDFIYHVGSSSLFVNYNTGNVGIGTTNPNQTLYVQGNITLSNLLSLAVSTLPEPCATTYNGTIGRNITGLYYCNNSGQWNQLG
jgi:uncharacterized protein YneR